MCGTYSSIEKAVAEVISTGGNALSIFKTAFSVIRKDKLSDSGSLVGMLLNDIPTVT